MSYIALWPVAVSVSGSTNVKVFIWQMGTCKLTLKVPETKIAEFANRVDLDEVAYNEPPHIDLPCLPSSL